MVNVPNLPGVPPIVRGVQNLIPQAAINALADISASIGALSPSLLAQVPTLSADLIGAFSATLYSLPNQSNTGLKDALFTDAAKVTGASYEGLPGATINQIKPTVDVTVAKNVTRIDEAYAPSRGGTVETENGAIVTVIGTRPRTWGIYTLSGVNALEADSVLAVSYSKEFATPDYPIEGGGFETYNKVERPYEARVRLSKGGTDAEKRTFQNILNDWIESLDLVNIKTPDYTYRNANIVGVKWDRTRDSGSNLLIADVVLREIRKTATQEFTDVPIEVDTGAVQNTAAQPPAQTARPPQ